MMKVLKVIELPEECCRIGLDALVREGFSKITN